MNFLIDNYSDYNQTQPLYLHKHINEYDEHVAYIKSDNNISIYDLFDTLNPDVYITAAHKLSKDAVLYLKENQKDKNIRLALSIQSVKNSDIVAIENLLAKHGVECMFFFLNCNTKNKPVARKTNIFILPDAADTNLDIKLDLNFKIDRAFMVDTNTINKHRNGTYHVITTNPNIGSVDFNLPVNLLPAMYPKYDEVIFTNLTDYLPQTFFDAILYGNKVFYDVEDKENSKKLDEICDKVFGLGGKLNYKNQDKLQDFTAIQSTVVDKHTSIHRTKSLLSQIPGGLGVNYAKVNV